MPDIVAFPRALSRVERLGLLYLLSLPLESPTGFAPV